MKIPGKSLVFWIIFPLIWTILTAAFIFYFDLADGPIIFLILELVLLVALFTLRIVFRGKKWWVKLTIWGAFIVLTIPNIAFCKPSEFLPNAYYTDEPIYVEEPLELKQGKVRGVYSSDREIEVYAGIQYAQAERWKEPKEFTWDYIKDGSKYGPRSMQPGPTPVMDGLIDVYSEGTWRPNLKMHPYQARSEEEGLNLNIWRPKNAKNLPILVFIHGGSLTTGSASSVEYYGETIARHGIIMITIQYRLGVFGYFAHPDLAKENEKGSTGNYGLLDQIFALEWIQGNAERIGGKADEITIAGESAGSSSVSALCTSPRAKGLFRYAIGESSSLVMKKPPHTYRTREEAYEVGEKIMKEFNCKSIDELRKVPAKKLAETKYKNQEMMLDGSALVKDPYEVYAAGENNESALLNGYNAREADPFIIPQFLLSPTNKNNIQKRLESYFNKTYAEKICELYKDKIENDAFGALNEIMSVYWFIMPHHVWSNMAINSPKKPVTVYRYMFTKENGYHGTYHSGEMVYAYGNIVTMGKPYAYDQSDIDLSVIMAKYWANFVKNGNPNSEDLPQWDAYDNESQFIIELGEKVQQIPDNYTDLYNIINDYIEEK